MSPSEERKQEADHARTRTELALEALPEEKKALFVPIFGDVTQFYTVVYLVARNEHLTDLDKPDRYADRLQVIRAMKRRMEQWVDSLGLSGEEIIADITSDYLEDYVNYRERTFPITNEEFLSILRRISQ